MTGSSITLEFMASCPDKAIYQGIHIKQVVTMSFFDSEETQLKQQVYQSMMNMEEPDVFIAIEDVSQKTGESEERLLEIYDDPRY